MMQRQSNTFNDIVINSKYILFFSSAVQLSDVS